MAGNLGIEEELVDQDFPTFLVHRETWKKMQSDHEKGINTNMMEIQEKQYAENLHTQLEIKHPELPDRMMSLQIGDGPNVKAKATEMRQDTDPLMENTDTETIHVLDIQEAEYMMHEENLTWDMEKMMEWDDNYTIHIGSTPEPVLDVDEDQEEAAMLTNLECGELKKFLEQEALEIPKVFCKNCSKRECLDCEVLRSRYSQEEQRIYKNMWDNVEIIQHEGKPRVRATYIYQNPPEVTFAPENSNMDVALKKTNAIINQLIKRPIGRISAGNR